MSSKLDKCKTASARLNKERYGRGFGTTVRWKKVIQFSPCPKALVFSAAMYAPGEYRPDALRTPDLADINTTTVLTILGDRAALTPCECHTNWTSTDALNYQFEEY